MNLSTNLRQTAQTTPDVTALLYLDQKISYRELNADVDRFAAGLAARGIGKGSKVALLLGNSPDFVIAYYAIVRLGGVAVPVNPLYTPGEIQFILADCGIEAVIAVGQMAPLAPMVLKMLPTCKNVILVGADLEMEGVSTFEAVLNTGGEVPTVDATPDDIAVILYTSGTTGHPKGALLSHRNLCSNANSVGDFLNMSEKDLVVAVLPMFHVFCMTVCLNAPLYRGATILVMPRFSPTETAKAIQFHQATMFAGVPTMFNFLLQHPEVVKEDLSSLKLAISGGAAMPVAVLEGFEKKFDVIVSEGYGLSEASPVVTFNPLDRPRKAGTIGVVIPCVEARVVDEMGNDVEPGVVGELICRGDNVMIGYLNRPEETALALRDGWLYTGDMATIDTEGYFSIVDRKKDMIIVGGFNVYPREVEEVLFHHPNVREAAVVGVPDANYGEKVRAYVALKQEGSTEEELIEHCQAALTAYKVPKEVIVLEELPKNTTGKILRRELRKHESNTVS
ncbi:long-chain fatty acid--CoA ligase [Tumebacillus algifaecis]|uniref:Long-chain fatty acid--CoA ligase n=1 Tax=Tumebacillus algifaecis TaxID=1214604 RepID=A0A223CZE0_9BACL|nr:long-chain-fatty-acid--CoA ligase [Tumebacillus algifaecis]ASS74829.1 long-chain fatty acid--CoA ligase [Tumebacillus algifaecis]